jgi:single stranded DNA-binding protein
MNRIQLIGRLGRDPEGGEGATGPYASFSLATHEYWTDRASGERREHTEWHRLVCYDRLASIAMDYLVKGSEVYVEGRLRSTQWVDKDLCEQRGVEVRVDDLKMLRRAPRAEPVPSVARGLASVETLLRQMGAGQRDDVSPADLAGMVSTLRLNLVGDEERSRADEREPIPASAG